MAGVKIVDLPSLGRDLISTDLLELSLAGGSGSRKITGQEIMSASKLNVGATPIINGTAGRILFQGAGDVLGESANLFWDNTNGRLGVGGTPGAFTLDILGTGRIKNLTIGDGTYRGTSITFVSQAGGAEKKGIFFDGGAKAYYQQTTNLLAFDSPFNGGTIALSFDGNTNNVNFYNTSGTILSKIFAGTGNWGINTTTDAGFKLDVNGTTRIANALTLGNVVLSLNSQGGGTISCANSAGANTGSFITLNGPAFLNPTAGNSGIFSVTGQYAASSGTANFNHLNLAPIVNNTGTYSGTVRGIYYNPTLTSLTGTTHRAIETVTGDVLFGTTSGNVGIGTSSPAQTLDVVGTNRLTGTASVVPIFSLNAVGASSNSTYIDYRVSNTSKFQMGYTQASGQNRFFIYNNALAAPNDAFRIYETTNNIGINVSTDAGFKFDVNGTARVSGAITIGGISGGAGTQNFMSNNNDMSFGTGYYFRFYATQTNKQVFGSTYDGTTSTAYSDVRFLIGGIITPHISSQLEVASTTKGFLPPRMTNAQRAAIASPAVGLIVYCTDSTEGLYVYKSTGWTFMV